MDRTTQLLEIRRQTERNYVVDGRLLGVVVLSGLQAACVASAGNRDGFAIISVVLLKFRSELITTTIKIQFC